MAVADPVRSQLLPIFRLELDEGEITSVVEVLKSGQISRGTMPGLIERRFAGFLGCAETVVLSSGTAALHAAVSALGLPAGSEVIVPSLSFVATAFAAEYCGLKPVFAEIDPATMNLSAAAIAAKLTSRTSAIMPVHYGGYPADLDAINAVAKKWGLRVIDDAAHAFGAVYRGKKIGALTDAACFSFFSTKNITCGEGGLVATNDAALAARIRKLRAHGIVPDPTGPRVSGYYDVDSLGYNYHLNNMGIGLLGAELDRAADKEARRRGHAVRLSGMLRNNPCVTVPFDDGAHVYHLYSIRLVLDRLTVTRDAFIEALLAEGIQAGAYYRPIHLFSYFRGKYGCVRGDLPVTERVCDAIVTLPMYPSLTETDVSDIAAAVNKLTARFRK